MVGKKDRFIMEKDTRNTWKYICGYLGWGSHTGSPNQLTDPATGNLTTSPPKMASIQNNYYITKVEKIRNALPSIGDPTKTLKDVMNHRARPRTKSLILECATQQEIDAIIKTMKPSKVTGIDHINTNTIKLLRPLLLEPITHIINLSLQSNTFPSVYKTAKIVPLYKGKGSPKTNPKSYRPVALYQP